MKKNKSRNWKIVHNKIEINLLIIQNQALQIEK